MNLHEIANRFFRQRMSRDRRFMGENWWVRLQFAAEVFRCNRAFLFFWIVVTGAGAAALPVRSLDRPRAPLNKTQWRVSNRNLRDR